jgi:hypothetical protein
MCSYLKKRSHPHKPLVLWAIQMVDQLSILLTHTFRHTKNTFLLATRWLRKITSNKHQEAFELLNDCVSMLRKFECSTGTIQSCPLLQANEAKATKAKHDKTPKCTAGTDPPGGSLVIPDPKHQRSSITTDSTPSAEDLSGTLIYTGTNMVPSVNEPNPAYL